MSLSRRDAYRAILLFGLVSLLGDTIYEGARAVAPSYLNALGATAFVVGLTFGISEFLGLSLRLVSGVLADRTRAYWLLYSLGYGLLISIPLMGFTNLWFVAAALIFIERAAKGLRSPARDVLISSISESIGTGKAFGLHELLDQVGAVLGPAILGLILMWMPGRYDEAFSILLIPYAILILTVSYVYSRYRSTRPLEESHTVELRDLPIPFWLYSLSVLLNTMGLIHVSLIVLASSIAFSPWMAAFLYVLMQGVDAISAPLAGLSYDKIGRKVLYLPFLLSPIPSILTLHGGSTPLIGAVITFGIIYGMQESIYRAAVSDLISPSIRGTAYGIFNTLYGLGFLISGAMFGLFLQMNWAVQGAIFALVLQAVAALMLYKSLK